MKLNGWQPLSDYLVTQWGWKPEWYNETGTAARIDIRQRLPAIVPFRKRDRFFRPKRNLPIRNIIAEENIRLRFSSSLSTDGAFLGLIESETSDSLTFEYVAANFPWDKPLKLHVQGIRRHLLQPDHDAMYFLVHDEETGQQWLVSSIALTFVREVFVETHV